MRDDLNASEKRLISALDRIDHLIDRASAARSATSDAPAVGADASGDSRAALAEALDRLNEATQHSARLAAANEALADANRALLAGEDASVQALQSEVEALRASREVEIAQMGDLVAALERMLSADATEGAGQGAPVNGDESHVPMDPAPEPLTEAAPAMLGTPTPLPSELARSEGGPSGDAGRAADGQERN